MARYVNKNRGFVVEAHRCEVDSLPPGLTKWSDIEGGLSIRDGSVGFIQWTHDEKDHRTHVRYGDWALTKESGEVISISDDIFQEHYESV